MNDEQKITYQTLFIMGIIFTGAGIAIGMWPMTIFGFLLMAAGGAGQWATRKKQKN